MLPKHELIIDTTLESGQSYLGMEWIDSGELRDSLLNSWGCDSLIITNITVASPTPTRDLLTVSGFDISLYPNPAPEILQIEYRLKQQQDISISLMDAHGRLLAQLASPQLNTAGRHQIRWPVQQLTPGVYFLRIQVEGRILMRKFVH